MHESEPSFPQGPSRRSLPSSLPSIAGCTWVVRPLIILCFAIALGACSKCDVPDLGHWGSPPPSHACHDGPPQQ
jgi:hypothetical protein